MPMKNDLLKRIDELCKILKDDFHKKHYYPCIGCYLIPIFPELVNEIKSFQEQKEAWLKTLEKLGSLSIKQHENFNNLADFALKIIDEAEEQILAQNLEIKKLKLELAKYKEKE